jgi:arginase
MDLGGNRRGVDMGPSALRLTDFPDRLKRLGLDVVDMGNVLVHTRALLDRDDPQAHFLDEILRACDAAGDMVLDALARDLLPLTLGGDHSVAIASMRAMAKANGTGGVIWIDAHADLNTPSTTISGNVHGMSLAVALGRCEGDPRFDNPRWPTQCVDPKRTVLIATRDLDPAEQEFLRGANAPRTFTIAEIDRRGIADVAEEAVSIASGGSFLHVTLDLDALDPSVAPGVGTPVQGGLSYREAHMLMETLAGSGVSSLDVVEVNPVLDVRNQTAELAGELICSLFGARIL